MTRAFPNTWILIALLACAAGCSAQTTLGGGNGKRGDSAENRTPQDPKKPTDDTEGLPGYLTDPKHLVVTVKDGKTIVSAPAGSVVSDAGSPGEVKVKIYQVDGESFTAPREVESGKAELPAELLGKGAVEDDGSFSVEVTADPEQILVVVLTPQSSTDKIEITAGKGVVFGVGEGPFSVLTPELLAKDRRSIEEGGETSTATSTSSATSEDTDTDTATDTPTCGGAAVQGACWYLSAAGESCQTACAAHGGYDPKTDTVAGYSGTLAACYEVLTALGQTGTSVGDVPDALGVGCSSYAMGFRVRWTLGVTTETASFPGQSRACACTQ